MLLILCSLAFFGCKGKTTITEDPTDGGNTPGEVEDETPGDEDETPGDEDETPGDEDETPSTGGKISFVITDDSAEEMVYTDAIDEAVIEILTAVAYIDETTPDEEVADIIAVVKEYLNYAKITEEQFLTAAALIEDNVNLAAFFFDETAVVTTDDVKAFLEFYKALIGILGNDALGKFGYKMLTKLAETADNPPLDLVVVTQISYENFAITSRVLFTLIDKMISSFEETDVDFIASVAVSGEEPSNTEIVYLTKILAKAIDAIEFDESVWTQFFGLFADDFEAIKVVLEDLIENAAPEEETDEYYEALLDVEIAKKISDIAGEYVNLNLKFISTVLRKFNVDILKVFKTETSSNTHYDYHLEEQVTEYFINGQEVTEEEFHRANFKVGITGIKFVLSAYKALDTDSQAKFVVELNAVLTAINDSLALEEKFV